MGRDVDSVKSLFVLREADGALEPLRLPFRRAPQLFRGNGRATEVSKRARTGAWQISFWRGAAQPIDSGSGNRFRARRPKENPATGEHGGVRL